jgi:hypothetical protein
MSDNRLSVPGRSVLHASLVEKASLATPIAETKNESGVGVPLDENRAAQLGRLAELPSLGEVLGALLKRIEADKCQDDLTPFSSLRLLPNGLLSKGKGGLPVTYRVFGNTLRNWCNPPRNVARVLVTLPVDRADGTEAPRATHSARSCAYNAYLDRNALNRRGDRVVLRSRMLKLGDATRRMIIGVVSESHSLRDGDDDKLVTALAMAFSGALEAARAEAFRGVEESEIRILFPAIEVELSGAGRWSGYVTARNSETGSKSWNISAGLYRQQDGASVACEAVVRFGRHTGRNVAMKMVEAAWGAERLLRLLSTRAGELAAKLAPWDDTTALKKVREALAGTFACDPDVCCGIAFELGRQARGHLTVGALMSVLGELAGAAGRRIEARPIEILLGRVLVSGWSELKAVGSETVDEEVES